MKELKYWDLLTLKNLETNDILEIVRLAEKVKAKPKKYDQKLKGKTLLMLFEKPSLRTHISFDVAMHQLGGHAIYYDLQNSTLGEKESVKDFSKVIAKYVDVIMARLKSQKQLEEIAEHSEKPVINALTDSYHPCQILGDLLTIKEKVGALQGVKIAYLGDANNNVTHSMIIAANKLGMQITVSCPDKKEFLPNKEIIGEAQYEHQEDPNVAVQEAHVIYTDTWNSYHIPKNKHKARAKTLKKYQVNTSLMTQAPGAKFMHNLPAKRAEEVTDEVMDSVTSIVYDQAENRTYAEKAALLKLLGEA